MNNILQQKNMEKDIREKYYKFFQFIESQNKNIETYISLDKKIIFKYNHNISKNLPLFINLIFDSESANLFPCDVNKIMFQNIKLEFVNLNNDFPQNIYSNESITIKNSKIDNFNNLSYNGMLNIVNSDIKNLNGVFFEPNSNCFFSLFNIKNFVINSSTDIKSINIMNSNNIIIENNVDTNIAKITISNSEKIQFKNYIQNKDDRGFIGSIDIIDSDIDNDLLMGILSLNVIYVFIKNRTKKSIMFPDIDYKIISDTEFFLDINTIVKNINQYKNTLNINYNCRNFSFSFKNIQENFNMLKTDKLKNKYANKVIFDINNDSLIMNMLNYLSTNNIEIKLLNEQFNLITNKECELIKNMLINKTKNNIGISLLNYFRTHKSLKFLKHKIKYKMSNNDLELIKELKIKSLYEYYLLLDEYNDYQYLSNKKNIYILNKNI